MPVFYAGIGSRKTPDEILTIMHRVAQVLGKIGLILRSGHAKGADKAFERGCNSVNGLKQIFIADDANGDWKALEMVDLVHPCSENLNEYVALLHARNTYQVLGKNHDEPVDFVVCWTKYGAETLHELKQHHNGGTSTAIKIACMNNIPVFNLRKPDAMSRLSQFINETYLRDQYDY